MISSGVVSDFVLEFFSLKNLFLISFLCARERERERWDHGEEKKKKKLYPKESYPPLFLLLADRS